MKTTGIFIVLTLGLLASCQSVKENKMARILNQDLSVSYQHYDESLRLARSELKLSNGDTVKNCSSYSSVAAQLDLDESIANQSIKSEYLTCDALKIFSGFSIPHREDPNDLALGEQLASKLDLRSFPSSLFRMSDEKRHTLKSLYSEEVTSHGPTAILETEDWVFRLEVVGIAQINENHIPDWVVWVSDESKSGNYRSYATLIVYDPEEKENYMGTSYP